LSALQIIDRPSPNFDARTRPLDLVVLHYTGMQDAETAIRRLTDPAPVAGDYPGPWSDRSVAADAVIPRVSAHYVLAEDGVAYRIVAEENRAWHAGVANWEGEGDVNARAIGIEIVNGGHDFDLPDFPDAQIDALILLLRDILGRWSLAPARVVGHSDVAPERKTDPGEKFPWKRLAEAGVSIWPGATFLPPSSADPTIAVQERLAAIGYGVHASGHVDAQTKYAIIAFQRRFRPAQVDGVIDDETRDLIAAVAHKVRMSQSV
jgi:N-acetylmuramoyl-L-alanine amidase